jgi:predicted porin
MALAVAGALAAPAAMAQVQIGGGIHLQYFNFDPDNDDASSSGDILTTSEPELYFRGEEKLGGGNSVWFQCTSSLDVLGPASSTWCGRNSAIGFRGGFGNVFAGNWDTPHKLVSNLARGWWGGTNTLQGGTLVLLANGSETALNNGNTFFRRQSKSINYHSPDWSGFNLQAAITSSNETTALPDSSPLSPRMMSIGGQFRTGPFFAGVGYEKHDDFNPAAGLGVATTIAGYTGGSDSSINVAVGYTFFGSLRASLLYMDNKYEAGGAGGVTGDLDQSGWAVYVDWTLGGPHSLYFQYADRPNVDFAGVEQPETGAQVLGAAYGYRMSKRTQLYFAFNQMKNDNNSSTGLGANAAGPTAGGKQTAIGVGLRHSF